MYLAAFYFCACVDLHAFQPAAEGTIAVFTAGTVCVPVVQQSLALGWRTFRTGRGFRVHFSMVSFIFVLDCNAVTLLQRRLIQWFRPINIHSIYASYCTQPFVPYSAVVSSATTQRSYWYAICKMVHLQPHTRMCTYVRTYIRTYDTARVRALELWNGMESSTGKESGNGRVWKRKSVEKEKKWN